jgi:hypothetical protein
MELTFDRAGADVRVSARGSRGEQTSPHALGREWDAASLARFADGVRAAAARGRPLDARLLERASALHHAVLDGEIGDMRVRLGEGDAGAPLLVRLTIRDAELQAVPWEALMAPGSVLGFWASAPDLLPVRGVTSTDPWEPREVRRAVRVLAIAPSGSETALQDLQQVMTEPIETGEIEWLEPIAGRRVSPRDLSTGLRLSESPHVIHFLGHCGSRHDGHPALRLDDEDGEEGWIEVEALARQLAQFDDNLRLLVLGAFEGADAGVIGSAAEIFARAGVDAVVAHLWPITADAARTCSRQFYRALAGAGRRRGDVAVALNEARRGMLAALGESAEAFAPVLYLRGPGGAIFDFERRKFAPPARPARPASRAIAPALGKLLAGPFTLVVSDAYADAARSKTALREAALRLFAEEGDAGAASLSLDVLVQRCALLSGRAALDRLLESALSGAREERTPPHIDALARAAGPGVHASLLWQPVLEQAIAAGHPDRDVYVVEPSRGDAGGYDVLERTPGADWRRLPRPPRFFDLDRDIVVLRLCGGVSADKSGLTRTIMTEDDTIDAFLGLEHPPDLPEWADGIRSMLLARPALLIGFSRLNRPHRIVLRWLYWNRPLPRHSVAVLGREAARDEEELWERSVDVLRLAPEELASLLRPEGS